MRFTSVWAFVLAACGQATAVQVTVRQAAPLGTPLVGDLELEVIRLDRRLQPIGRLDFEQSHARFDDRRLLPWTTIVGIEVYDPSPFRFRVSGWLDERGECPFIRTQRTARFVEGVTVPLVLELDPRCRRVCCPDELTCNAGRCVAGRVEGPCASRDPPACPDAAASECDSAADCVEDGDPCTAPPVCHEGACVYAAAPGPPCDDGHWCTEVDRCDPRGLCGGTPRVCPTGQTCDEARRACVGCTPSGAEVCDGVDNDCSGGVDDVATGCGGPRPPPPSPVDAGPPPPPPMDGGHPVCGEGLSCYTSSIPGSFACVQTAGGPTFYCCPGGQTNIGGNCQVPPPVDAGTPCPPLPLCGSGLWCSGGSIPGASACAQMACGPAIYCCPSGQENIGGSCQVPPPCACRDGDAYSVACGRCGYQNFLCRGCVFSPDTGCIEPACCDGDAYSVDCGSCGYQNFLCRGGTYSPDTGCLGDRTPIGAGCSSNTDCCTGYCNGVCD